MRWSRLRLAQQVSLLLGLAMLGSLAVVGSLSLWNLRAGFADYLQLRDEEQLAQFVQVLERRAAADPSMEWLRGDREAYRSLIDTLHGTPPPPVPPAPGRATPPHTPPHGPQAVVPSGPPPAPATMPAAPAATPPAPAPTGPPATATPPLPPATDRAAAPPYRPPPPHDARPGADPRGGPADGSRPYGPPPQGNPWPGPDGRPPGPPPGGGRPPRDQGPAHPQRPPPPPPVPLGAAPGALPLAQAALPPATGGWPTAHAAVATPSPAAAPPGPPPGALAGPVAAVPRLADRIVVRDAQGRWLAGRPQPADLPRRIRTVEVGGRAVASVELTAERHPAGLEARFLQRQTRGLLAAALGTLAAGLLAAAWLSGRWSRPLHQLQRALREVAQGRRMAVPEDTGALEITHLAEDLNRMARQLARLEDARRLWIAQTSHELRTPLAVLRGEIEALQDGVRQPSPALLASLHEEVLQLARLVDDLHLLSTAELDGLRCQASDGDAQALWSRVAARFAGPAAARGLVLDLPAPGGPALPVCWDLGRMEQVLANLLTNSLRYTDAPGQVRVRWGGEGMRVWLRVEDSAPGVPDTEQALLFEPLYRADAARRRTPGQGSGLGLSIVRLIVQAHEGRVSARSSALGGLDVLVELPAHPRLPDDPRAP